MGQIFQASRKLRWQIRSWLRNSWRNASYRVYSQYVGNPPSRRLFRAHLPELTAVQRRVLQDLSSSGVALVRYDELGIHPESWARLQELVEAFAMSAKVEEAIRRFPEEFKRRELTGDDYMVKLYPDSDHTRLAADHPLLQVGLSAPVLSVINSYLGLWAKLIYTDVWHTFPIDMGKRIGSQRWHRDPEDSSLVKVYIHFSEVDETAGPLEYILGSAERGPYGHIRAWKPRTPRYPPPDEIERLLPAVERVRCVGGPGTVVFCDTGGFHRGGVATQRPRIAATWTFVRPASIEFTSKRRFQVDNSNARVERSLPARFALE
jgi:hypothetical protein